MIVPMLAVALLAAPSVSGVRLLDIVTTHYENSFDGVFDLTPYPEDIVSEADATLDYLQDAGPSVLGMQGTIDGTAHWAAAGGDGAGNGLAAGTDTGTDTGTGTGTGTGSGAGAGTGPDSGIGPAAGTGPGSAGVPASEDQAATAAQGPASLDPARIRAAAEVGIDLVAEGHRRSSRASKGKRRSSARGVWAASSSGLPRLTSVRAIAIDPGRVELLAVGVGSRGPVFVRATYFTGSRSLAAVHRVEAGGLRMLVSLRDLTLHLRDDSGEIHLVNPVGAGGFIDDHTGILMTPVLLGAMTRTPGRAWMDTGRYRSRGGSGAMLASRSHPEYYEGLPFIRLRRFDEREDVYAIHGPIAQGGTFPIAPRQAHPVDLAALTRGHRGDPQGTYDALDETGLIDRGERLVRGRITNGCLRQRADDLAELFALLDAERMGVPVTVTYASDPDGVFHPFPYETRRFAIATGERDEEGLMVMYTANTDTQLTDDLTVLPYPDEFTQAKLEKEARERAIAVAKGRNRPADLRRLASIDDRTAATLADLARGRFSPAALGGYAGESAPIAAGAAAADTTARDTATAPPINDPDGGLLAHPEDLGVRTAALLRRALERTRPEHALPDR